MLSLALLVSSTCLAEPFNATPTLLGPTKVIHRQAPTLEEINQRFKLAYDQKRYLDAASLGLYAVASGETQPPALYNFACALARSGDKSRAFGILERAVKGGFADANLITTDTDLESLHTDKRWQPLLKRISEIAQRRHAKLTNPETVEFITSDIPRFWSAYDKALTLPADKREEVFQNEYLAKATPAMKDWIRVRRVTAKTLTAFVNKSPKFYAGARAETLKIAAQREATLAAFRKFKNIYPEAEFPGVVFPIGAFYGGGTVSNANLLMSAEMYTLNPKTEKQELSRWQQSVVTPASDLPSIIAHEMIHFQQRYAPSRTLLAGCLEEGAADFLGELCSGTVGIFHQESVYPYGNAHEKELWEKFQRDMNETDKQTVWLYSESGEGVRPDDLGYFMGYKICESYYKHATDKKQAVYDILHITNYNDFLTKSRYAEKFK